VVRVISTSTHGTNRKKRLDAIIGRRRRNEEVIWGNMRSRDGGSPERESSKAGAALTPLNANRAADRMAVVIIIVDCYVARRGYVRGRDCRVSTDQGLRNELLLVVKGRV
jgi:hypothetical protein